MGQEVVKLCAAKGYSIVLIDRTELEVDGIPNAECRFADIANDYDDTVKALKGCDALIHLAAIPNPINKSDSLVHTNNVSAAFNGFRACGELGIKRISYASSVNAIGLLFSNQPLKFEYFPIDEDYPTNPTDAYALAKLEGEVQAKAFANWFPGMKIACLRIHQVAPKEQVQEEHVDNAADHVVKNLWAYVNPEATARACLLAVEKSDNFEGCEIFNIVAPETTQDVPSIELAQKHYPDAEIRPGLRRNSSFWVTDKAERILGWQHHITV